MPAADPLALVLFSGQFDRVHYGLAMAASALAINRPVTLFFTMGALQALRASDRSGPGWLHLLPGETGNSAEKADLDLHEAGVGGLEELLEACLALGAEIMVCEMGLKAIGLAIADLRPDFDFKEGGLATFLGDMAPGTAMVFI